MTQTHLYQPTNELPFLIKALPHEHYCNFEVYEVADWGKDVNGDHTIPYYTRKDAIINSETVNDYKESGTLFIWKHQMGRLR